MSINRSFVYLAERLTFVGEPSSLVNGTTVRSTIELLVLPDSRLSLYYVLALASLINYTKSNVHSLT